MLSVHRLHKINAEKINHFEMVLSGLSRDFQIAYTREPATGRY